VEEEQEKLESETYWGDTINVEVEQEG